MVKETFNKEQLHLPFQVTPGFARRLARAAETMSFADAVTDTLADSRITVEVEGDLPPAEGGLLIAGDHSQRIEPLLVQTLTGAAGREGASVIAQPDSFSGRLMQDSGADGQRLIIPVMPTRLSDQYQPTFREDPHHYYYQHQFPQAFNLPVETLRVINNDALDTAARRISDQEAVTIFPTGGAITDTWRGGMGQIAHRLSPESRHNSEVSLFQTDPFSLRRVVGALGLREFGIRALPSTLVLRNANVGKISDMADDASDTYPADFTTHVRELYRQQFGK